MLPKQGTAKRYSAGNTGILHVYCLTSSCVNRILENLPFWHKQTFAKTQLNIFKIYNFCTFGQLNLLAVKFHTKSILF